MTGWKGTLIRWPWLVVAASLALCVVAYLPAVHGEFLFDDEGLLLEHDCWRGLDKIPAMFGWGPPNGCNYRPGRYLTYALDFMLGGLNPTVYHVTNVIYHLLTALAVWVLFRRWASAGAAALLMAIWALHPVQADAVAYISGRRDIISTLFFVLAFLQLFPPEGRRLGIRRILLGSLCFLMAIFSKEMAVTLPAVLVWAGLVNHMGRREDIKPHLKRFWPLYSILLAGAALFVLYHAVFASASQMDQWWGGSAASNFATVFSLYPRYLWLIVWPARLVGDYFATTIPIQHSFAAPMVMLGIALYAAFLVLLAVSIRRGWRATAFGIGWFLVTMLPVSHIFPHHEIFAEHYLYLPSMGLFMALLPLVQRLTAPGGHHTSTETGTHDGFSDAATTGATTLVLRRLALAGLALVIVVACTARTASRAADFKTAQSFYEAAYVQAPMNTRATYNLGLTYLEADDCQRAVPLMLQAAERLSRPGGMSRGNLVAFLNCSERLDRPDIVDTLVTELLRRYPVDPLGLAWRGRRHLEAGRLEEAAEDLGRSVLLDRGQDSDSVAMLALVYNQSGRHQDALDLLELYPGEHVGYCEQQVRALVGMGVDHYDAAFARVNTCLVTHPDSLLLLELRAGLYFSAGLNDLAESDLARLEELGAPPETLERVRAWRGLRQ